MNEYVCASFRNANPFTFHILLSDQNIKGCILQINDHSLQTSETLQICSLRKTTLSTAEMKKSCCLFEHAVAQVTVTLRNPSSYRNQLSIMKARKDVANPPCSLLDL